jgi:ABC-type nitrate/sulfonate/bicarbonate transport system substrate-binding protein
LVQGRQRGIQRYGKNPAIKKIADLKGKAVAGQKGSALNHLLFVALKKEGLTPADIKYVNMAGPQALAALISDTVDAALITGPSIVPDEAASTRVVANGNGLIGGLREVPSWLNNPARTGKSAGYVIHV